MVVTVMMREQLMFYLGGNEQCVGCPGGFNTTNMMDRASVSLRRLYSRHLPGLCAVSHDINELVSFVVSPLARERLKGENFEFVPEARRSGKSIRPDDLYVRLTRQTFHSTKTSMC